MNTLAIAVLIIIVVSALRGLTEGFIKTTFRFALNLVVFVISLFVTPVLLRIVFADFLMNGMEAMNQLFILIIIFALFRFGAKIIVASLDIIAKLPVLKSLNRLLGLVAGLLQGLIFVWAFLMVAMFFSESPFGKWVETMCMETPFLTALYQTNPIVNIVEKYLF